MAEACETCGCPLTNDYADHVGYEQFSNDDACIMYLKAHVFALETELAKHKPHG